MSDRARLLKIAADVAFMVTKKVRQGLYDLNYPREVIDTMKPQEAVDALNAGKVYQRPVPSVTQAAPVAKQVAPATAPNPVKPQPALPAAAETKTLTSVVAEAPAVANTAEKGVVTAVEKAVAPTVETAATKGLGRLGGKIGTLGLLGAGILGGGAMLRGARQAATNKKMVTGLGLGAAGLGAGVLLAKKER